MPAPQSLMQAALSRLGARLGSGLLDAAANAAVLVQEAPETWRRELRLFWEEVEQEAQRLEQGEVQAQAAEDVISDPPASPASLQARIDAVRAQVAGFSRRLDQTP